MARLPNARPSLLHQDPRICAGYLNKFRFSVLESSTLFARARLGTTCWPAVWQSASYLGFVMFVAVHHWLHNPFSANVRRP